MTGEIPSSIDPKELVEQEGLNKGAIKDNELAQVGAHEERKHRERDNTPGALDYTEGDYDEEGEKAMVGEVSKRAKELVPEASKDMKDRLAATAGEKFIENVNDKYKERLSLEEVKDNAKAEELIKKLEDAGKEKGETVKKVEWGETAPQLMTW